MSLYNVLMCVSNTSRSEDVSVTCESPEKNQESIKFQKAKSVNSVFHSSSSNLFLNK